MSPRATRALENAMRRLGYGRIAGVDEVGRGSLAGPVLAAAVVLDPARHISGLRDSKQLTPARRELLFARITSEAAAWSVAAVEVAEIDRLNIHRASLHAMHLAVSAIAPPPDFVLVDAFRIPELSVPQRGVVHGDDRCAAIAAASIVAKVRRDALMCELHARDPRYGFDRHKGYATAAHLEAMARHGYSEVHRRSFRPPSLFDVLGAESTSDGSGEERPESTR
jgi:ribonuclease HII